MDTIEQVFVGNEWVIGSGFHPALTAVTANIIFWLTNGSKGMPYIASFLFNLLAVWSLWRLALEYLKPQTALVAVFSMFSYWFLFQIDGIYFCNTTTVDALWILSVWLAFKAIQTERLSFWLAAGLGIGAGLYCKYAEIILAFFLVLFLITNREKRHLWKTPGPWISISAAILLFLPYLIWLFHSQYFGSIDHIAAGRKIPGFWGHFIAPLKSLIYQIVLILPPLLCLVPVCGWLGSFNKEKPAGKWENRYLTIVLWGPLVFNLLWSAVTGTFLQSRQGSHIWLPLALWLLVYLKKDESPKALKRGKYLSIGVDLLFLIGFSIGIPLAPLFDQRVPRYFFPGDSLAEESERIWHSRYNEPLPWVTGYYEHFWPWLAGNVSVFGNDRASVYSGPKHCTWGSIEDVRRSGGLFLWTVGDWEESEALALMDREFPNAERAGTITLKPKNRLYKNDIVVGAAVIPPKNTP